MSPRLIEGDRCPHCRAALPEEKPRVCPECGGSLQKRYLSAGCLTSKPLVLLLALGVWSVVDGCEQRPFTSDAVAEAQR